MRGWRATLVASLHVALPVALAFAWPPSLGLPLDWAGYLALVFGVSAVYCMDRLDPRERGPRSRALRPLRLFLARAAFIAGVGLVFTLPAAPRLMPALATLAGLTLAHGLVARVPGGKAACVAACWSIGVGALAVEGTTSASALVSIACAAAASAVLCDLADAREDLGRGRRTLASRWPAIVPPLGFVLALVAAFAGAHAKVLPLLTGGLALTTVSLISPLDYPLKSRVYVDGALLAGVIVGSIG